MADGRRSFGTPSSGSGLGGAARGGGAVGLMPRPAAFGGLGASPGSAQSAAPGGPPDGLLLDRFLNDRDEAAFEALVVRHGARVRRVCRRWLGDGQDAEDACQSTFLILIDRAGSIRQTDDVGGWLCGVARRVAARSRQRADRRRRRESSAVDVAGLAGRDPAGGGADDLDPILRAEVTRLPERYRRPIELCYWEGLRCEQAAERLRCPPGTLKWRLSRAREILRSRLVRYGVALTAVVLWRVPETRAATALASGSTGSTRRPRPRPWDDASSAEFVRQTVALAVAFRDSPLCLKAGAVVPPGRGPFGTRARSGARWVPGWRAFWLALLVVLLSTSFAYSDTTAGPFHYVAKALSFFRPAAGACH